MSLLMPRHVRLNSVHDCVLEITISAEGACVGVHSVHGIIRGARGMPSAAAHYDSHSFKAGKTDAGLAKNSSVLELRLEFGA